MSTLRPPLEVELSGCNSRIGNQFNPFKTLLAPGPPDWHASSVAHLPLIRITTTTQAADTTVITIDGWLTGADLDEVRRIRALTQGHPALRLGGLDTCAPEGIRLLQDWLHEGAKLESASPFLQMVLVPLPRDSDRAPLAAASIKSATV